MLTCPLPMQRSQVLHLEKLKKEEDYDYHKYRPKEGAGPAGDPLLVVILKFRETQQAWDKVTCQSGC